MGASLGRCCTDVTNPILLDAAASADRITNRMGWSNSISWLLTAASLLCPIICGTEGALHAEEGHVAAGLPDEHPHEVPATPHHDHDSNGDPVPHTEHTCFCTSGVPSSPTLHVLAPSLVTSLPPAQAAIRLRLLGRLGRSVASADLCPDHPAARRMTPLLI